MSTPNIIPKLTKILQKHQRKASEIENEVASMNELKNKHNQYKRLVRQKEKNAFHLQLMEQLRPSFKKHKAYMRHKSEINKFEAKLASLTSLLQSTKESSTNTTTKNTPEPTVISMSSNESVSTGITTVNSTTNLSPSSSSKTCGQNCNCAFNLNKSPFESLFSNDNNNKQPSKNDDQTIGSVSSESTTNFGNTGASSSLDSIRRQINFESYMNTSFKSMNRIIDSSCSTTCNEMNEELVNNNQNTSGSHGYNLRSTNQSHSNNNNSNNNASGASNSTNINNVNHNDNHSVNSNYNTDVEEDEDDNNDNNDDDTDDHDDNSNGGCLSIVFYLVLIFNLWSASAVLIL